MAIKSLIFVCTGNTCRSVMAEALFKKYWFMSPRSTDLVITSAGIAAFPGDGASQEVKLLLKEEEGIDITYHSATPVTPSMLKKANLIMVMGWSHKNAIEEILPEASAKTFLLKEYVAPESASLEISDPFGRNMQIYRETMQEIRALILKLIEKF